MEQAQGLSWEDSDDQVGSVRQSYDHPKGGPASLDKVLRFALAAKDRNGDPHRKKAPKRDLSSLIDVVHRAAEAMRFAEARAQDMEARAEALAQRATEELKAAEARIQAAEARARAAEARAQEAEEWLARVHDEIIEQLSPNRAESLQSARA